jgi:translocation and assembly module TamB
MAARDNAAPPSAARRQWPRRLAIGLAASAVLLAAAGWLLGRESTLRLLVQKIANASGGSVVVEGVSGSLYGAMHVKHALFRSPDQLITGDDIDIDWSPLQLFSDGVAIDRLQVARLAVQRLRTPAPSPMPASLAPPFALSIRDARFGRIRLTDSSAGAAGSAPSVIEQLRFALRGDRTGWTLREASAGTPWGRLTASGSMGAAAPFKLDASARLSAALAPAAISPAPTTPPTTAPATAPTLAPPAPSATLDLRLTGDLARTELSARGQSGAARADATVTLAPFDPVALRTLHLQGQGINPGAFNPALPTAELRVEIDAAIDARRNVDASVKLDNVAAAGTLDVQRLPLRTLRGRFGGNLARLELRELLIDLGEAGTFSGKGTLSRPGGAGSPARTAFVLHTDRLDLNGLHRRLGHTGLAGDLRIASSGTGADATETISAKLTDRALAFEAEATLAARVLTLRQARLSAAKASVRLSGTASLGGARRFELDAEARNFNPAAFGSYPVADINADAHASGDLAPDWSLAAEVALQPSRLLRLPLSGKGRFHANARHVSAVQANFALGRNTIALHGEFGAPGEQLLWRLDGAELAAAHSELYGVVNASGALGGGLAAPRSSFELDAVGLGLGAGASTRAANRSALHASGEAWLGAAVPGAPQRALEIKASGSAQRFNPGAFGAALAGSINASFDGNARLGAHWRAALNLALQPSTLANEALSGHVRLNADDAHIGAADIELRLGPNLLTAQGGFGGASEQLAWRLDAPRLDVLGAEYGGTLRGSGAFSGTRAAPALTVTLDGQNLRAGGGRQLAALRARADLSTGSGGADRLASEIEIVNLVSGATRLAGARLQTSGTRGAHSVRLTARGEGFDASAELRGGLSADGWSGTIERLQNRGRHGLTLQAPAPLRLAGAPGSGLGGLLHPAQLALTGAVLTLPDGSINLRSLTKDGAHWSSSGGATGVPLTYLAQSWPALREGVSGDLALGAAWALDLQGGAAPLLGGTLRLLRERGDLVVGSELPVRLGLRQLEARAELAAGALRLRLDIDGVRAGHATLDASARLQGGRLANDSALTLSANADMGSIAWLAPLGGQPGLELDGALKLALSGAGTLGAPTLDGSVSGDALALTWAEQGVKLRNGQLRATLEGDRLLLRRLSFDGVQGHAVADGVLRFGGGDTDVALKLVAERLEVLARPDRTVVLSGQGTLTRDARQFALEGKFRADHALIELAPQGRPTLSSDVIVLGQNDGAAATKALPARPLTVDIEANLGDRFELKGMGIDALLSGTLRIRGTGGRRPRVNGTLRVQNGTYAAYGQKLQIEQGVLNFSGAYDNPALSIRALRKRPDGEQLSETNVEAGVEVRGTALAPSAKLISTPNVPDSDKLAWLVLGHDMAASAGNEAGVLGAAAGALLGGANGGVQSRLASSLGVDELGLSQARGLETTVVTVGKRLSSRAYLSFEQGASTASSVVRLRYKLNPRITLQLQTGTNSALDVLYSWAFD